MIWGMVMILRWELHCFSGYLSTAAWKSLVNFTGLSQLQTVPKEWQQVNRGFFGYASSPSLFWSHVKPGRSCLCLPATKPEGTGWGRKRCKSLSTNSIYLQRS